MINDRKAELRAEIARRERETVGVDLGALLASVQEFPPRRGLEEVCPLDDCGCSGRAHP